MLECQNWLLNYNSGMTYLIVTKFGVFRDQAVMQNKHVIYGAHLHVRTSRFDPFLYLGNGWTDCAEIWCVVKVPLARHFAKV